MKTRLKRAIPAALAAARFIYANRKAELALAAAVMALVRELVQATTGH
jgi:hypothetical protein